MCGNLHDSYTNASKLIGSMAIAPCFSPASRRHIEHASASYTRSRPRATAARSAPVALPFAGCAFPAQSIRRIGTTAAHDAKSCRFGKSPCPSAAPRSHRGRHSAVCRACDEGHSALLLPSAPLGCVFSTGGIPPDMRRRIVIEYPSVGRRRRHPIPISLSTGTWSCDWTALARGGEAWSMSVAARTSHRG